MEIKIKRIRDVKMPTRGTPGSAGIDFYVPNTMATYAIQPGSAILIKSGIKAEFPEGHALIAFNKSSIAVNKKAIIGACVIDEDYQGELGLHIMNVGHDTVFIHPNEKIAQFILVPIAYPEIVEVDAIHKTKTERGEGGYGSTVNI